MTEYTADDFKRAEFARSVHRDVLAVRAYPRESAPWLLVWRLDGKARCDDATMARSGTWAPVQENPRHLTPDAITDEMVERARTRLSFSIYDVPSDVMMRAVLVAALTETPARPEGAEELAAVLRSFPGTLAGIGDISDHLASCGVRVTGAES